MYRTPGRGLRSPGPPRPPGGFSSPGWPRSPYGQSPRGSPYFSPGAPGYQHRSPGGYNDRPWDYGGNRRRSGDNFRRPHFVQGHQNDSVEKYFSPSMLQDPWEALESSRRPSQTDHSVDQTTDVTATS